MAHDHPHGHDHSHASGNEKTVGFVALLTGTFMLAELFGGIISGSLALLADAGHMLTDFAALVLAWFAFRLARRPATTERTYGFDRFSVLAAFVNGLSLFLIAGWICFEAYQRLSQPNEIVGSVMLWVAFAGLCVNILAFWLLMHGEKDNLNIRAAALHVMGDLLGSVAALVASLVIIYTGWTPIDPILSVLVALIILRSAWYVVKQSAHILLEGAPLGFDSVAVAKVLERDIAEVLEVRHIHAWCITQERPMVTLEAVIGETANAQNTKAEIKKMLHDQFGIEHTTVEIENHNLEATSNNIASGCQH